MNKAEAFAAVNTLPRKEGKGSVDPRATRYGFQPIWKKPVQSNAFYVWEIPANQVFPFRPFIGETVQDYKGDVIATHERMPADQIIDMSSISQFFVELPALAGLKDESKAQAVAEVLYNPKTCDKYPVELKESCATCWLKDIISGRMLERIQVSFSGDEGLFEAAITSMDVLRNALTNAVEEARRRTDEAIRDIDDPKSGKSVFYDTDYLNVFHTHADRPQYRTVTSNANVGTQIAEALAALSGQRSQGVDNGELSKIVAEAVARETASLRAELDKYKDAKEPTVEVGETGEEDLKKVLADKIKAKQK